MAKPRTRKASTRTKVITTLTLTTLLAGVMTAGSAYGSHLHEERQAAYAEAYAARMADQSAQLGAQRAALFAQIDDALAHDGLDISAEAAALNALTETAVTSLDAGTRNAAMHRATVTAATLDASAGLAEERLGSIRAAVQTATERAQRAADLGVDHADVDARIAAAPGEKPTIDVVNGYDVDGLTVVSDELDAANNAAAAAAQQSSSYSSYGSDSTSPTSTASSGGKAWAESIARGLGFTGPIVWDDGAGYCASGLTTPDGTIHLGACIADGSAGSRYVVIHEVGHILGYEGCSLWKIDHSRSVKTDSGGTQYLTQIEWIARENGAGGGRWGEVATDYWAYQNGAPYGFSSYPDVPGWLSSALDSCG